MRPKMADVLVRNEGSIVMFTPKSQEAKNWVDDNLGLESWQWLGPAFAVEWRYAPDIVNGMTGDGLEVLREKKLLMKYRLSKCVQKLKNAHPRVPVLCPLLYLLLIHRKALKRLWL